MGILFGAKNLASEEEPNTVYIREEHNLHGKSGRVSRTAGMPSAHALGLGDVRLKLTRPMGAFYEAVLSDGTPPVETAVRF